MSMMRKELRRLSHTLLGRGAAMLVLGTAAVIWPEPLLVAALLTVGLMATLFGLYEMTIAVSIRRFTTRWRFVLIHGLTSLSFGLLTVGAPALSLRVAVALIATWLLIYAGVAWGGAMLMQPMPKVRTALIAWGAIDVLVAIVILVYPAATIFGLLFFGAVYAALFGAWQIALGTWVRRTAPFLTVDWMAARIFRRIAVTPHGRSLAR